MKRIVILIMLCSIFMFSGCSFFDTNDEDNNTPPTSVTIGDQNVDDQIVGEGDKIVEDIGFTFIKGKQSVVSSFLTDNYKFELTYNIYNNDDVSRTIYSNAFKIRLIKNSNVAEYMGDIYFNNDDTSLTLTNGNSMPIDIVFTISQSDYDTYHDYNFEVYFITTKLSTLTIN